ncbi:cation efflux family protein family [Cryomyces antarcticus]|uniref:Zinc transporter n=1 Tax=Cryomyces antarcticus TaxID=329879 RepID=A0ABR0LQL2_9PEZI|nr:cation diffusion zinc membrane transporter Zrg17 [Cryomyces antarcticus]
MADSMPIPLPPRTPTPPPDDESEPQAIGLGLGGLEEVPGRKSSINPDSLLSPLSGKFAGRHDFSQALSPTDTNSLYSPVSSLGSLSEFHTPALGGSENARNPFNFTPMQYTAGSSLSNGRLDVGKRRGHKYKHSSIHTSHQIFQEPAPRPPLQLPTALDIPGWDEIWKSITREQASRAAWCCCHLLVAVYVHWSAQGSLAMTSLSRLLFFDFVGALLCVGVDVAGNFPVWKSSSIKHPFGLERVDVLIGFGMAVFIGFMGLDVLSHGIQHSLENTGGHVPHHTHKHERVSPGSVDTAALFAILATSISASLLGNHARIGKAMRFAYIQSLPSVLSNPSHFLTLSCSGLLLILPLLSIQTYTWFDMALSFSIALAMVAFGVRLGMFLASMLLMSYSGPGRGVDGKAAVKDVIAFIERDPAVTAVDEARLWQVHYGLCMANLKLRFRGSEDVMIKLRERVESLVRSRLGGGYGGGGTVRWEVSTQLTQEKE